MNLCVVGKIHPVDVQPNIVLPFTEEGAIFDAVKLNLATQGLRPRLFKMERTYSYDLLFRQLWNRGAPFIIVEQDILPWPGALAQLWQCNEPWCGFPYFVFGELRSYLGCTKFDPAKLGECPLSGDLREWMLIDKVIEKNLLTKEFGGHLHSPAVTHLNVNHSRLTRNSQVSPSLWRSESL